ncbi:spore germination protein [Paenibacillus brasilensis]
MPLFKRIFHGAFWKQSHNNKPIQDFLPSQQADDSIKEHLEENEMNIKVIFANCPDVIFRAFKIKGVQQALLVYLDGLSDTDLLDTHVLLPLMQMKETEETSIELLLEEKLSIADLTIVSMMHKAVSEILSGNPVLFFDHEPRAVVLGLAKWEKRSIEEPQSESVVRGPREGFTESISVNMMLLRRRIKTPNLKFQPFKLGTETQTQIFLAYHKGTAEPNLIEEVTNRLRKINLDAVLESSYIEELIEDNPYSPFPQILETERADVVCASLLEGRVAILIDGTPFVLIAPITVFSLIQSAEDYYSRWFVGSIVRILRYVFIALSLLLPSIYVAIVTFHPQMLPLSLLFSFSSSRELVPFPTIVEALMMEIAFEALREAGIRLPKQIGAAVSIVGAIVIGDAAVRAGLVSAPMVIVVAITGVSSFVIPHYSIGLTLRVLRFPIMILAGFLGIVGVMLGIMAILLHLCTLRSFGVPYLSGIAPTIREDLKDQLIRAPWWAMNKRPHLTGDIRTFRHASPKPGPTPQDDDSK